MLPSVLIVRGLAWWVAFSLLVVSAQAQSTESPFVLADGTRGIGRLTAIDERGELALLVGEKRTTHKLAEVVRWGTPAAAASRAVVIRLADGSQLVAEPTALAGDRLKTTSLVWGEVELPRSMIRAVAYDLRTLRDLEAAVGLPATTNRLRLQNGDELAGNVTAWNDKQIEITLGPRKTTLKTEDVALVTLAGTRAATVAAGVRAMVGVDDGSRLITEQLTVDDKSLRATLAGKVSLQTSARRLRLVQPVGGRVTYLSDLTPTSYKHVPFLSLEWPLAIDRSVAGGPLRVAKQEYWKGLGMHSPARATYVLAKPYRQLQAEVAIDDHAAGTGSVTGRGSVTFRVFVDTGDGQWQPRYVSPIIRGGAAPTPIQVDLTGAKRISLLVDFADRGDELDHADWLDARLLE